MDKKGIKTIMPLIRKIEERFQPERIILFGSRARDDYRKDSDYDLIIVADSFSKQHIHDRAVAVYAVKNILESIDVICYAPEEFEKMRNQLGIINQAMKEGIDLLEISKKKAA